MAFPAPKVHIDVQTLDIALADSTKALLGKVQRGFNAYSLAQVTLVTVEHRLLLCAAYDLC